MRSQVEEEEGNTKTTKTTRVLLKMEDGAIVKTKKMTKYDEKRFQVEEEENTLRTLANSMLGAARHR